MIKFIHLADNYTMSIEVKKEHANLFEIIDNSKLLEIINYACFKYDYTIGNSGAEFIPKVKKMIYTIDDLCKAVEKLTNLCLTNDIFLNYERIKEQIVMDLLYAFFSSKICENYNKASYFHEHLHNIGYPSHKISLEEYCRFIQNDLLNSVQINTITTTTRKTLERMLKKYFDKVTLSPTILSSLRQLGIDPNSYTQQIEPRLTKSTEKKKSILSWDNYFYNSYYNITSRQYNRKVDNRKRFTYSTFIDELKIYKTITDKISPKENESPIVFFYKMMRFYHLETYKQIDFIVKQNDIIKRVSPKYLELYFQSIKRYVPEVVYPIYYKETKEISFERIKKYYRPMIILNDEIFSLYINNDTLRKITEKELLELYTRVTMNNIARAKIYELFRYHYSFKPDDDQELYSSIKKFLIEHYDLRKYHYNNKIWNILDQNPKDLNGYEKYLKDLKKNFIIVNNCLFPKDK